MNAQVEVLRWPQVHRITGLSRTTVWRLQRTGKFPKSFSISTNAKGWLRQEVEAWVEKRAESSTIHHQV